MGSLSSSPTESAVDERAPSAPGVPGVAVQIIDDDPAVRGEIGRLLGEAGIASRTYASALEFLPNAHELAPGCIVTALGMPEIDGFELMTQLKVKGVTHPVIMISGSADVPKAVQAMRAGAQDVIEKPLDGPRLLAAVRAALGSEARALPPLVPDPSHGDLMSRLTRREADVLQGVVAGKANKVIARELGISPRTVETHRAGLMAKTGAGSVPGLVRLALLAGL